jgi:hypothetical protein
LTTTYEKVNLAYRTAARIAEVKDLSYGDYDWWWRLVEERKPFRPEERPACTGLGPDWFYPPVGENPSKALGICRGCPARLECLQHALDNNEDEGMWGGVTQWRRRKGRKNGTPAAELIEEQDAK